MSGKIKELTKDTAIYGVSSILSRFLNFILVPFYTNVFRPDEYGVVAYVYAFIAFLNVLYLYGMEAAFMKYASLTESGEKKDNFSVPFFLVFTTSALFSALISIFGEASALAMEIPERLHTIIYYTSLILFFDAISAIPFANLRLLRKAKKFAIIKTINICINVALNLILILKYKLGVEAVFISNLTASCVTFILLIPEILNNIRFKFSKLILAKMLKFGLPYLPAGLASMTIQVIDRPILQTLTDTYTVGVYQANHKLGVFMMLFVSMFQYAWQPFFLNNAKLENAKEIFSKVLTYFAIAGTTTLVVLSLFVEDIVKFEIMGRHFIQEEYWSGLTIVPIILLGYLFNGIYVNFTAGIFIKEKTSYVPYATGIGAVVNIIGNYLLIPLLGMNGAALAMLLSYIAMAAGLYIASQKFYPIKYEYLKLGKILLILIAISCFYYYCAAFKGADLILKFSVLIFFFISLYAFKIISKSEIKSLIKTLKLK